MKVFFRFTCAIVLLLSASSSVAATRAKKKLRRHPPRKVARHSRHHWHSITTYRAPLLPAREWEGVSVASAAATSPVAMDATQPLSSAEQERSTASKSGEGWRLGVAGGVLAHEGALPYDSLNSQLYYGGRINLMAPLTESIWLRPSLGFFLRSQNSTYGTTSQYIAEGNVNVQYALIDNGFKLLAGVLQSVQMGFSHLSGSTVSNTTGMDFSYHIGPSLGGIFEITPSFAITIDGDATYDFKSPFAPFIGITGGVLFRL